MIDLFKSECSRIMKITFLATVGHTVLLLFMLNFDLLFSIVIGFKISLVFCYGCYGLLLAVLQMRLYKEQSQWVYLLNRPLSANKVFMSLFAAVLLSLIVSIVLPVAVVTWAVDALDITQIDRRHYTQLYYLLGVAVSFYLTGVFLSLIRNRWFALLLILPLLPLMSLNSGGDVLLLLTVILVLLFTMVLLFFKMNLQQQPQGKVLVLTLVLQWSVFTMIMSWLGLVQLTVEEIAYLNSQETDVVENSYPNHFRPVSYLNNKQKILAGLSTTDTEQVRQFAQQSALNEAFRTRKRVWFHPTKQQIQLMDERGLVIHDEVSHTQWTFSHDHMLFVGKDLQTLEPAGFMGPTKHAQDSFGFKPQERFNGIPWIAGHQFIVGNILYRYDEVTSGIEIIFAAKEGEWLLNVLQQNGEIYTLITHQNIYVFDAIVVRKAEFPLQAALVMPLPVDYNNIWDATVIQAGDDFLMSFLYGKDPRKDVYPAGQVTYRISLNGIIEKVASRELEHNQGTLMRYADYLISPFWTVVTDRLPPLPARDRYLEQRPWPPSIPGGVLLMCSVIGMACLLVTWLWSRQRKLSLKQTLLWSISNAMTGLPGLLAFSLLNKRTVVTNKSDAKPKTKVPEYVVEVSHV